MQNIFSKWAFFSDGQAALKTQNCGGQKRKKQTKKNKRENLDDLIDLQILFCPILHYTHVNTVQKKSTKKAYKKKKA